MTMSEYNARQLNERTAEMLVNELYSIAGTATAIHGEMDLNYRIKSIEGSYILKVSRPDTDKQFIAFQADILNYVGKSNGEITTPVVIKNKKGNLVSSIKDKEGDTRFVRLYSWIEGRLWSSVNSYTEDLMCSLGKESAKITKILQGYDHPAAHREFDWDISQAEWTVKHAALLDADIRHIARRFQERFLDSRTLLASLRKGVVHNDANDNNIIVSPDLKEPVVVSIIDYGDAIYTELINNLAVTIAYAVMGTPDPLQAALPIVKGYHEQFPLQEDELTLLYTLVAMRLVISLTKSAMNKVKEPENTYLQISEEPAKKLLQKWYETDSLSALSAFRKASNY